MASLNSLPLLDIALARERVLGLVKPEDAEDPDTCWLFTGKVKRNGYARVTFKRRSLYLHRLAYMAFKRPIQQGHDICHRCDNRRCARPEHLFSGTRLANMQDAKKKGRLSSGRRHALRLMAVRRTKLSWPKVEEIRRRAASGEKPADLASDFGCDATNIRLILRQRIWKTGFAALS